MQGQLRPLLAAIMNPWFQGHVTRPDPLKDQLIAYGAPVAPGLMVRIQKGQTPPTPQKNPPIP